VHIVEDKFVIRFIVRSVVSFW